MAEIGEEKHRLEILDWYHLTENIYKVEAKKRRVRTIEKLSLDGRSIRRCGFSKKVETSGRS